MFPLNSRGTFLLPTFKFVTDLDLFFSAEPESASLRTAEKITQPVQFHWYEKIFELTKQLVLLGF